MHLKYKETKHPIKIIERISKHAEPHLHNALELVYVTEGALELGMGTELYHMETGELGFIFPDVIHHYQVFCKEKSKAYYMQISPFIIGKFSDVLQNYAPKNPIIKKQTISEELKNAIKGITNTENDDVIVEAYMQIILAKCIPMLELTEKESVGSTDIVYQAVSYISSNFREQISLESMAMDLGVSKYVLSRVFSGIFHRNFSQYLNDTRMNYAKYCLETTNDVVVKRFCNTYG